MNTLDETETWQATLGEMEVVFSKANYSTWFKDTFIAEIKPDKIIVSVPNNFSKEWLENNYNNEIFKALKKFHPTITEVEYKISASSPKPKPIIQSPEKPTEQTQNNNIDNNPSLPTASDDKTSFFSKYIFDSFIVGNSNRLAVATAQAVAKEPGTKYNPLFIYGGVGLGKTHLVQAIGNEITKKFPKKNIVYTSCEKFTNDYISSISSRKTNQFKKNYRNADVLMIDDIQFMSGKEGTQEEFFHTFNALHQANRQIIITSDRVPKAIPQMTDRLSSRFGWGMVADIQPPNFEMRQAILKSKCTEKNVELDEDVLIYIAQNIESNIRELEGAITRVISYAEMTKSEPKIDIARQALADIITSQNTNLTVDKILKITTEHFEISINDVLSTRRNQDLVRPRQIIMYLLRHEMSLSYPKIGQHLNKKDHTTIIHGVEKIEKELARDIELHKQLQLVKEKLHSFE